MDAEGRIVENPFLVLGVAPDASRVDIEREAGKLLGMLELGLAAATAYETPLGPRTRTPDLVRAAAAALRDPETRLIAEVWARGLRGVMVDAAPVAREEAAAPGWDGALRELGWSRG